VRFGDLIFLKLTRYDLFDLVFKTKRDLGDFFRVDGWSWQPLAASGRKNWTVLVT
jgi:hypothetical protein